jgi:hypothetical protein
LSITGQSVEAERTQLRTHRVSQEGGYCHGNCQLVGALPGVATRGLVRNVVKPPTVGDASGKPARTVLFRKKPMQNFAIALVLRAVNTHFRKRFALSSRPLQRLVVMWVEWHLRNRAALKRARICQEPRRHSLRFLSGAPQPQNPADTH